METTIMENQMEKKMENEMEHISSKAVQPDLGIQKTLARAVGFWQSHVYGLRV